MLLPIIFLAALFKCIFSNPIMDVLYDAYFDRESLPPKNDQNDPIIVWVSLSIFNFNQVDDMKMEFRPELYLRQYWHDQRFNVQDENVTHYNLKKPSMIWTPDTFFTGAKDTKWQNQFGTGNQIRIFNNGRITFSVKLALTIFCPMKLMNFPFDKQICPLQVESYGYDAEDLKYKWHRNESDGAPVHINNSTDSLSNFMLEEKLISGDFVLDKSTNGGKYSTLWVKFVFGRQISYYVMTVFIPSITLVTISWFPFYITKKDTASRTALGITTLLTLVSVTASAKSSIPPVAYYTALDIWTLICNSFLFLALLQSILVTSTMKKQMALKVDKFSKLLFPISFFIISLHYFFHFTA